MKLLIVSFSELTRDARVLRQISLFAEHHEVITAGFGAAPPGAQRHIRLPLPRAGFRRRARAYAEAVLLRLRAYRLMYWTDPMVRQARRSLRRGTFDAVIANDVNTVPLAFSVCDPARVHADLHEYYPGLHDDVPKWVRLRKPYLTWLVRRWVPSAATVTTVSGGLAEAYRDLGVTAEVVTNAPEFRALAPARVEAPLRIVHAGAALPGRRIEVMMQAVAASRSAVALSLYLTPNDQGYLDELHRLADALGERIQVLPPVAHEDLLDTLNGFDLGIHVLPPSVTNQALALPNKFFDFVQARLGVIVGPSAEMARLVREHGLGIVTEGFDENDVRVALDALDADTVQGWKEAADRAAHDLSAASQLPAWQRAVARLERSAG